MFDFSYEGCLRELELFLKSDETGDYMAMIPYLKDVVEGDKLWDILYGWGTVRDVNHIEKRFKLYYDDGNFNYVNFYGFLNSGYGQLVFFDSFNTPSKITHNNLCGMKIPKRVYFKRNEANE